MTTSIVQFVWPLWRRIAFRFFFIFFSLEIIVNYDFLTLCVGVNMAILQAGQKIMTPPFVWLNENLFHLNYNPIPGYFTFTYSLILIRHIVYAGLALVGCVVWSFVDKERLQYNRLDYWFRQVLCIILSAVMWGYAIDKILPVQMSMPDLGDMQVPLGEMTPFTLLWTTLGYGVPYQVFTGIGEGVGCVLILFRRTRMLGLLVFAIILTNIVMLNYTYAIGVLSLSFLLLLITLYLLIPYLENLSVFFFTDRVASQFTNTVRFTFTTRWKKIAVTALGVIAIGTFYAFSSKKAFERFGKRTDITSVGKYAEVKRFVLDSDTLDNVVMGDTVRWRFWSEVPSGDKVSVTVYFAKTNTLKKYDVSADSLNHRLTLKPSGQADTTAVELNYTDIDKDNWRVEGLLNGRRVVAELQRIDPNVVIRLLRVKRQVFETDPVRYEW